MCLFTRTVSRPLAKTCVKISPRKTGWWLNQPLWKIWVKMGLSSPRIGVKKNIFELPPPRKAQFSPWKPNLFGFASSRCESEMVRKKIFYQKCLVKTHGLVESVKIHPKQHNKIDRGFRDDFNTSTEASRNGLSSISTLSVSYRISGLIPLTSKYIPPEVNGILGLFLGSRKTPNLRGGHPQTFFQTWPPNVLPSSLFHLPSVLHLHHRPEKTVPPFEFYGKTTRVEAPSG